MRVLVVVIGIAAWLPVAVSGQVFRWVDSQGRVHYSDDAPSDIDAERVEIAPGPSPRSVARARLDLADLVQRLDSAAIERQEDRDAAAAATSTRAADAVRQRNCAAARRDLAVLDVARPAYLDDQGQLRILWAPNSRANVYSGDRTYIEEDDRAALLRGAQQAVAVNCDDPDDASAQEAAEADWLRSEDCSAARSELRMRLEPGSRTPASIIERKQREVALYCDGQPGG